MKVFNKLLNKASTIASNAKVVHLFTAQHRSSEILARYFAANEQRIFHKNNDAVHSGDAVREATNENEIELRLDTVSEETCNRLDVNELYDSAPDWAKEILKFLRELDADGKSLERAAAELEAEKRASRGAPPVRQHNNKTMQPVLDKLLKIGMVERLDATKDEDKLKKHIAAHANMFMVEKPGSEVMMPNGLLKTLLRIITDARDANVKTTTSIPYEIFTLDALQQCISNLMHDCNRKGSNKWFAINVDLRHWFHQIGLPSHLRNLFQIHAGAAIYRILTLPMGWYLSPPIAQAATWSILLGGNVDLEEWKALDVEFAKVQGGMPAWLPFKSGLGGIFIIQDNILIVTPDRAVANRWRDRLHLRAKAVNAEFKNLDPEVGPQVETISLEGDRDQAPQETEFTGIVFRYGRWQQSGKKFKENMFEIKDCNTDEFSYIEIASALGEILWSMRVRRLDLLDRGEILDIFKINTPDHVDQWKSINRNISKEQLQLLAREFTIARSRPWCNARSEWRPAADAVWCYAADASMNERGEQDAPVVAQLGIARPQDKRWHWKKKIQHHVYIGEAELEAILWCMRDAIGQSKGTVRTIVVATDSLCAKGWAERMYSERPRAREILMQMREILRGDFTNNCEVKLCCVYIRTDHNIADIPSRDELNSNEGNNDAWLKLIPPKTITLEEIRDRMKSSRNLLSMVRNQVLHEGVMQGRLVIRRNRDVTEQKRLLGEHSSVKVKKSEAVVSED
jgi:hypothetical protein